MLIKRVVIFFPTRATQKGPSGSSMLGHFHVAKSVSLATQAAPCGAILIPLPPRVVDDQVKPGPTQVTQYKRGDDE